MQLSKEGKSRLPRVRTRTMIEWGLIIGSLYMGL